MVGSLNVSLSSSLPKVRNNRDNVGIILDGWMTCDLTSFSTGFQSDYERLCAMESHLQLKRFPPPGGI